MSSPPARPKIYHITHVNNLPSILQDGGLFSDSAMIQRGGPAAGIGMSTIKARRLRLAVTCHAGLTVGGCVPFYFCPRSIMLFIIHRGNHPEVTYRGGQEPILHLQADLHEVVRWADAQPRRWAFTLSNAGAFYVEFRSALGSLAEIDWTAVNATDFRDSGVKEGKQAEFLIEHAFPWHLVERIGVHSFRTRADVTALIAGAPHRPPVDLAPAWYY